MVKNTKCQKCGSTRFVKHGLTSVGLQRYRCIDCSKTWSESNNNNFNVDLANISALYLEGKTIRELVEFYPVSLLKINQQVRNYLSKCPDWINFLDNLVKEHKPRQIYLSGKKFNCSWFGKESNEMFAAFAIDSMTGLIISYKVSCGDTDEIWHELLKDLKSRNIFTLSFLTNGSESSHEALNELYPNTEIKINYHRNYRDKEIGCCLSKFSPSDKLINDAVKIYFLNGNYKLIKHLGYESEEMLHRFLQKNKSLFLEIMKERLHLRTKLYNDNLPAMFQKRFEKFHLLKENPFPIINSWVSYRMLTPDINGITRLALYTQEPHLINFKLFSQHAIQSLKYSNASTTYLERLLLEVAARGLELPTNITDCNFDANRCLLVG